jgi:CRP-like cAMP-binding protein
VYVTGGAPGANKIGILRAGAMVGEPGLFADGVRTATVEAMTPAVVWALRLPRFEELCARIPVIAVEILRAAGSVMALRMRANMARQTPVS